jgi:hypothetical protein
VAPGLVAPEADPSALPGFLAALVEFLRFKGVPLPERCVFDVVAGLPGQEADTLAFSSPGTPGGRLLGGINLGDEPAGLVFLNLSAAQLRDRLPGAGPDLCLSELVRRELALFPDHPLVGCALGPGEGYWLPADGAVVAGTTLDGQDIDVQVLIRQEAVPPG